MRCPQARGPAWDVFNAELTLAHLPQIREESQGDMGQVPVTWPPSAPSEEGSQGETQNRYRRQPLSAPGEGRSHRESQVQMTRPPSTPGEGRSQGEKQVTGVPDETTSCQPVWAQSVTAGSTMVELRGAS